MKKRKRLPAWAKALIFTIVVISALILLYLFVKAVSYLCQNHPLITVAGLVVFIFCLGYMLFDD